MEGERGRRRRSRGDPDAELSALVAQLRRLDDTPPPDATFGRHLEEALMDAAGQTPTSRRRTGDDGPASAARASPRSGAERARGGWSITAVAVGAVFLLAIAVGFLGNRLRPAGPDDGAARLAAITDASPTADRDGCVVTPRAEPISNGGWFGGAGLPATPVRNLVPPAAVTPSSADGTGPPLVAEDDFGGREAGVAVRRQIERTLAQLLVCTQEDRFSDTIFAFYFYTDDYFRRPSTTGDGDEISYWSPPPSLVGSGQTLTVREARVLPDGRVGAIVEGPFAPVFFVFVEAEPVWRIDEWVLLAEQTAADGTPRAAGEAVGIGVSAGCGPTPAQDGGSSIAIERRTVSAAIVASADGTFRPSEFTMAANLRLNLVLLNCGDERVGFVIDELGVDRVIEPLETISIGFQAAPGTYRYDSDLPGQAEAGWVGTLRIIDQDTLTP